MTSSPHEGEPPWLALARAELGTREEPGGNDNPRVVDYYRDAGHPDIEHDSVAWCAAFACAMLERSDIKSPRSLRARDFMKWGTAAEGEPTGAVAVLSRGADPTLGHVGFLVGRERGKLLLLGGNQNDEVSIERYPAARLLGLRMPRAPYTAKTSPTTGQKRPRPGSDLFEQVLGHVLEMEGGWSDDPVDPGGPTNRGITLAVYAAFNGVTLSAANHGELKARLRRITRREAAEIYRTRYWEPALCNELPRALALFHFDCAVNQGVGRAARLLQEALGVGIDGEIGPQTLAAARSADVAGVLSRYAALRRAHYRGLSHFWRFGRGWLNRVTASLGAARALVAAEPTLDTDQTSNKENSPMPTEQQTEAADQTAPAPKWWGHSLTIWGAIVTTLAMVVPACAQAFGIDITPQMIRDLGDGLAVAAQALAGVIGVLMTILGRVRAVDRIGRREVTLKV